MYNRTYPCYKLLIRKGRRLYSAAVRKTVAEVEYVVGKWNKPRFEFQASFHGLFAYESPMEAAETWSTWIRNDPESGCELWLADGRYPLPHPYNNGVIYDCDPAWYLPGDGWYERYASDDCWRKHYPFRHARSTAACFMYLKPVIRLAPPLYDEDLLAHLPRMARQGFECDMVNDAQAWLKRRQVHELAYR